MRINIAFFKKQAKNNFLHLISVLQVVIKEKSVSESRKEKISNFQDLSQVCNYLVLEAEIWLFWLNIADLILGWEHC